VLGEEISLNQLIQTANNKIGPDQETLVHLADQDNVQGTVAEVMSYIEENQSVFSDPNLDEIKTALSGYLGKMAAERLRLTMAAIKRELEEFKNQKNENGKEGKGILSQDDLDALLAEAQDDQPPPKSSKGSAGKTKTQDAKSPATEEAPPSTEEMVSQEEVKDQSLAEQSLEDKSCLDQSDIDALLSAKKNHESEVEDVDEPKEADTQSGEDSGIDSVSEEADTVDLKDHEIPDRGGVENTAEEDLVSEPVQEPPHGSAKEITAELNKPELESGDEADQAVHAKAGVTAEQCQTEGGGLPEPEPSESIQFGEVLEEKGKAKVLKEFFRVYVKENGSFKIFIECEDKEEAKGQLEKAVENYPFRNVLMGKIVRKEVLVVKEDMEEVPFSVQVKFPE